MGNKSKEVPLRIEKCLTYEGKTMYVVAKLIQLCDFKCDRISISDLFSPSLHPTPITLTAGSMLPHVFRTRLVTFKEQNNCQEEQKSLIRRLLEVSLQHHSSCVSVGRWLFGQSVGWSVALFCHNFKVTLPFSHRATCLFLRQLSFPLFVRIKKS